jgi:hypothetical protein
LERRINTTSDDLSEKDRRIFKEIERATKRREIW